MDSYLPDMEKLRVIIFDIDDTLKGTEYYRVKIRSEFFPYYEMRMRHGVDHVLLPGPMSFYKTANSVDLTSGMPDGIASLAWEYYCWVSQLSAPDMPHAADAVEKLSRKYILGFATNGIERTQTRKLESMGVLGLFTVRVLSGGLSTASYSPENGLEAHIVAKPNPQMYRHIMYLAREAAHGEEIEPWQVALVDDKPCNIVGAIKAGMTGIYYCPGGHDRLCDTVASVPEELAPGFYYLLSHRDLL